MLLQISGLKFQINKIRAYRLVIMGGTGVIADETADRIFGGTE